MLPAIKDGDKLLFSPDVSKLERGDIILFKYPEDPSKYYIKRIVGLPSEKIEVPRGKVFINDAPLEEAYVDESHKAKNASTFRQGRAKQLLRFG